MADLLGTPLADGDSIELSGVDAPPRRYTIKKLATRIGDMAESLEEAKEKLGA